MGKFKSESEIRSEKLNLLPCPFCGGKARLKKHRKIENTWYVQCHDCGIRTPNSIQLPYEAWQDARDCPIVLWNRRVTDDNKSRI